MMKRKVSIFENWKNNNIFDFWKSDALLYFFFYNVIPVSIAFLSLCSLSDDIWAYAYCYLSIFVSTANAFYDIVNRWKKDTPSLVNFKLFIMAVPIISISIYSIFQFLSLLIVRDFVWKWDIILYFYFLTVSVSLIDIVCCFTKDISIMKYVKETY